MQTPDFAESRRQLRRARIQDALTIQREGVNVDRHRNRLLEPLVLAARSAPAEFDGLPDDTVDTVVSLALAELDERPEDSLVVVLLCLRVLAADGQFARLALLADKLRQIGRQFQVERPFLATAVESFALALQGRDRSALQQLEESLGLGKTLALPTVARSREQLNDILNAATLRALLSQDDRPFAEEARKAALSVGDGQMFAFLDAAATWHDAAVRADPLSVLQEADPTFNNPLLQSYVSRRGIQTLFPSQIAAIAAGATLDADRMVSLPTSSGKTLLAEFRIAATLVRNPGSRAIYVAPYRLLGRQVERSFRQYMSRVLDFSVRDLGSGYDPSVARMADTDDVVVCSPERLDALLRLSTSSRRGSEEAASLFEACSVLVLDELQLIGRPGRGARLELILSRLRAMHPNLRVLGLSAATHGAEDVAVWLTGNTAVSGARRPTGTLEIVWEVDGTLRQRVARRPPTAVAELPRAKAVDDAVRLLLRLNERYRPALAVCVSRSTAESLAAKLLRANPGAGAQWRESLRAGDMTELVTAIEEVKALLGPEHPLADCMYHGIAFHHAGVPTHILQQIEHLASRRLLRVVCATTTVAEGADLPFRAVVIPHLNFPGTSGRLERDLYLNIIGRAGRANVSVEGIVFLLDSSATTLRTLVRTSLWSTTASDRVRGRLSEIPHDPADMDDWNAFQEVQSQVLAWLGDGASYVTGQATVFAQSTFSYQSGSSHDRRSVVMLVEDALASLENDGYALAASPYRLTERGHTARLTGLSTPSVGRLETAIARGQSGWMADLVAVHELNAGLAVQLARLLFEATEVFENSLYIRRTAGSQPRSKLTAVREFSLGQNEAYRHSDHFAADIDLLSGWIMGDSYVELARKAPIYDHANALFGGTAESKRTSDATEYIGKLTYPASWVWSAVPVLADALGDVMPAFIRSSIELGLPSEAATGLAMQGSLSRLAALAIAERSGPRWVDAQEWITGEDPGENQTLVLTRMDAQRLGDLRERLLLGVDIDPF